VEKTKTYFERDYFSGLLSSGNIKQLKANLYDGFKVIFRDGKVEKIEY